MTTSHLTPRFVIALFVAATAIGVSVTAQQRVSEAELLLREALHKQQVQGDLLGAIGIYQQIVSARSGNRAVVARALLELAGCYEKLGRQAETVYQQIVRDFGDQPAALQARARLAALRPSALATAMTLRKLDVADDVVVVGATDGERAVYQDSKGTIFIGDLSGKVRRALAARSPAANGTASRDLSSLALYRSQTQKISIIKTDGTPERVLDLTEDGRPITLTWPGPRGMTWSWDNRYLLIVLPDESGARMMRISAADGKAVEVVPDRRGITNGEFSPDGQFIAYRQLGIYAATGKPSIYIVPASGGDSQLIATNAGLVDWTRDGRHVLIRARGVKDQALLVAVPVQHGRQQGEHKMLRPIPAPAARTMINGSLFVSYGPAPLNVRDTWVGIFDERDASIRWTAMDLVGTPIANTYAVWLRDGNRFAYVTGDPAQRARVVRVKNVATDEDRELYRADVILGCVAAHHQDVLFCARAVGPSTEVVSVSLESGRTETRGTLHRQEIVVQMTSDDRKIVFYNGQTNTLLEWDIATGEERPIPFYRSADARWSLIESADAAARTELRIRPAAGDGDWRFLVARRVPPPGYAAPPWRFSPDGNWVVYHDRDAAGRDGLFRISTEGGEPQRLGDYPIDRPTSALTISDDGRRFVVHAPRGRISRDYWVLENFLPAAPPVSPK